VRIWTIHAHAPPWLDTKQGYHWSVMPAVFQRERGRDAPCHIASAILLFAIFLRLSGRRVCPEGAEAGGGGILGRAALGMLSR
jgi:hypothetical protein